MTTQALPPGITIRLTLLALLLPAMHALPARGAIIGTDDRVPAGHAEAGLGPYDRSLRSFVRLGRIGYLFNPKLEQSHGTGTVTCRPDIVVTTAHILDFLPPSGRAEKRAFIRAYRFRLNDPETPGAYLGDYAIADFRIGTWSPNAEPDKDLLVIRLDRAVPAHVVPLALHNPGEPPDYTGVLYDAAYHADIGLDPQGRVRAGGTLQKAGRVPVIAKGIIMKKRADFAAVYPQLAHPAIVTYSNDTFSLSSGSALVSRSFARALNQQVDFLEVIHKGRSPNLTDQTAALELEYHPIFRFNYGISARVNDFVSRAIGQLQHVARAEVYRACTPFIRRALTALGRKRASTID